MDTIMKSANIISLNETHFGENDTLTPKMPLYYKMYQYFDMTITIQVVGLHSL